MPQSESGGFASQARLTGLVAAKRIRRIRELLVDDFGEYGSHRGGLVVVKRLDCGKARHQGFQLLRDTRVNRVEGYRRSASSIAAQNRAPDQEGFFARVRVDREVQAVSDFEIRVLLDSHAAHAEIASDEHPQRPGSEGRDLYRVGVSRCRAPIFG